VFGTSPLAADTDGDGVPDGVEVLVDGTDPRAGTPVAAAREATVRGGSHASTDQDETSYLMVKHSGDLGFSRKTYLQFDLPAAGIDLDGPATLWLRFTNSYPQRVRLWGLRPPHGVLSAVLSWNSAPANDTASNSLLAAGAAAIGDARWIDPGQILPRPPKPLEIPRLGDFVFDGRVTLALCGEADPANHSSGLRLEPGAATLQYRALPPEAPFDAWRRASFGAGWQDPALGGPGADPDGDGVVNLLEYAFAGVPLDAASRGHLPLLERADDAVEFRFPVDPARGDLGFTVQAAADPGGPWEDLATAAPGATPGALEDGVSAAGRQTERGPEVVVRVPPDAARHARFFRLAVALAGG
jgi:hypothetical protein